MVSGTLNRETDEIEKIRNALGHTCAGTFDAMPAHTPRAAVIAAAEQARAANADLIVTRRRRLDHRRRQGRADSASPTTSAPSTTSTGSGQQGRGAADDRACGAPDQRADDDRRRRVQRAAPASPTSAPRSRKCCAIDLVMPRAVILDPAVTLHTPNGCGFRPASAPSTIASRACARARRIPTPTPRR